MLQDHVKKSLAVVADGTLKLPADVEIHSGKWVTRLDHKGPTPRRMFRELTSDQIDFYPKLTSTESIVVIIRVSRHQDLTESDGDSLTDTPYHDPRGSFEGSLTPYREGSLDDLGLRPGEALKVAASRLVRRQRATMSDPKRPHVSEDILYLYCIVY